MNIVVIDLLSSQKCRKISFWPPQTQRDRICMGVCKHNKTPDLGRYEIVCKDRVHFLVEASAGIIMSIQSIAYGMQCHPSHGQLAS